jgi:hypothetical protein
MAAASGCGAQRWRRTDRRTEAVEAMGLSQLMLTGQNNGLVANFGRPRTDGIACASTRHNITDYTYQY